MNDNLPHRKRLRLQWYDYSSCGAYFLTLGVKNRTSYFWKIIDGEMLLSEAWKIIDEYRKNIPKIYPHAYLDEFIIMPDHIHWIIMLKSKRVRANSNRPDISQIMKWFKQMSTKALKRIHDNFSRQRSFYDKIIRDETALKNIRNYIRMNPIRARAKTLMKDWRGNQKTYT